MDQYTEMKVVQLRTFLKKHQLSSKGNKSVLLKRIEEFVCPVPVPALVEQDVKGTDSMIPENIPNVGKESVVVADPTNFDPELPKLVTKSEIKTEEIKMEELALETEKTENLSAVPPVNPTPPINIAQRDTSQNKRNSHAFSPPPSMPNRKKKKVKGPPQTKNSLMVLNEMQPGLKYELVEQTQGSNGNSPSFTYELEFKGIMYRGSGSSKKIAKRNTATAALQRQIQFEQPHVIASCFVPMIPTAMDFTSDDLDFYQQPYMVPIPQAQEMQMQSLPPPPIPPFAQPGMQMPPPPGFAAPQMNHPPPISAPEVNHPIIPEPPLPPLVNQPKIPAQQPMNQQIQQPVPPGSLVDQPNSNGQQNQPIMKMEIDSPASKPVKQVKQVKQVKPVNQKSISIQNKNPVQLVNELAGPSLKYNCVTKVGDQKSHYFVMEVEINGKKYEGQGKNKVAMNLL